MKQVTSAILVATLMLHLVGCGDSQFCTLVGFESRVGVRVPEGTNLVEFCLGDACVSETSILLGTDEPETYDYRVVVAHEGDEEQVFAGEVSTKEYFRNGEGCDPKTANATLQLLNDGSVNILHP